MKKPIIGIVSNKEYVEKGIYKKSVYDVNEDYLKMIYENGGSPIIIPYTNSVDSIKSFLNNIDALLLIGGEDVFIEPSEEYSRDVFEFDIYNFFKNKNRPIMGICRGLQIINVVEGGTLKNIDSVEIHHSIELDGWINYHEIKILKNTKLKSIISKDNYTVSSLHHQAIDKLGESLVISAVANDGIIEAIETNDDKFIIAFQGHIEKCTNNYNAYTKVIKEFIKEARK